MNDDKNANSTSNDSEVPKEQTDSTAPEQVEETPVTETAPEEPAIEEAAPAAEVVDSPAEPTISSAPETDYDPVTDDSASSEPYVAPVSPVAIKEGGGSRKKLIISGIIVAVMIALLVGAWLVFSGGKKDDSAKTTTVVNDIGVLRVADVNGPIGTDAIFPNAPATQTGIQIDFQVYEGLVGYSNQHIVPLLAESWTNPDTNTWVFKLKKGVTFQNGKTVTATDVKTSLDTLAKDDYWGQFMQTVASVSTNGDNEVTIKTSAPDSLLLNRLVYGLVYQTNADKTVSGTGAYTVDAANSKTEDKTRLVAYDAYHQGKPKTRVIEYTIYPDYEAVVKALNEKKADYATLIKTTDPTQLPTAGTYTNTDYSGTGAYSMIMNMVKANTALQKLEVRQALAYALDRATYIKESKSSKFATNYMIPKSVVGYDQTAAAPDFNSTKAKELLTKAGYPNGLPLTFNYINNLQSDVPILVNILNKSGFKITAKAFPSPKEFVTAINAGNYDLVMATFNSDLNDGLDVFASLLGSETSQFPTYNNPAFDKMLTEASQAFKAEEHIAKVQEINRYVKDNSLTLPVSNGEFSVYYPESYNFVLDSSVGVAGTYFWKLGNTQTTSTTK